MAALIHYFGFFLIFLLVVKFDLARDIFTVNSTELSGVFLIKFGEFYKEPIEYHFIKN